jgi:hypothetical protein
MFYSKYDAQSHDPFFVYISQKLKGMYGDEFSIIIESESNIYLKEYGEGDDEEWEEGTEPFTINGKIVYIPPALLGMTQAQFEKRFKPKRKSR